MLGIPKATTTLELAKELFPQDIKVNLARALWRLETSSSQSPESAHDVGQADKMGMFTVLKVNIGRDLSLTQIFGVCVLVQ